MKIRRINEASLVAPKVNSSSYAGPTPGAPPSQFIPQDAKQPTGDIGKLVQTKDMTPEPPQVPMPRPRPDLSKGPPIVPGTDPNAFLNKQNVGAKDPGDTIQRTAPTRIVETVKGVIKEYVAQANVMGKGTLGDLRQRYTARRGASRPLSSTKVGARYQAMEEEVDKAEETEKTSKVTLRKKVPGPNLTPRNLSVN